MREEMIVKHDGKNNKKRALRVLSVSDEFGKEIPAQDLDFPFVEYNEIATATENFSDAAMIGKGGFGKVYKVKSCTSLRKKKLIHQADSLYFTKPSKIRE